MSRPTLLGNGTIEEIEDQRHTLGYDVAWLEYGFLDAPTLSAQFAVFQSGDDKNTEHYRYASFCRLLISRSEMDDETIARYIHLAEIDTDRAMAQAALGNLLLWDGLTEAQQDRLSQDPLFAAPRFQKLISRNRLLSALEAGLKADSVSEETFAGCLAGGDAHVQRALVLHRGITPEQLQVLAERGRTRAVRNIAKEQQKRKRKG